MIDNSVALAWCFQDERTPALMAVLDRVEAGGAFAPQLWPLEASNALLVAVRRGRISADERTSLLRFLAGLPIAIDSETAVRAWTGTAALAERRGLTAYDAAFLGLALRLALPLTTRDRARPCACGRGAWSGGSAARLKGTRAVELRAARQGVTLGDLELEA